MKPEKPTRSPQSSRSIRAGRASKPGPLETKIGYAFTNPSLLSEACRHSSFVNEQPGEGLKDNERLEFLGDAVLSLAVSHMLMDQYPDLSEGDLSRMRANLVNENQLAAIARRMGLGGHIQLGKGELQTLGRQKPSILADTLEALTAAIYLDGGFAAAQGFLNAHFTPLAGDLKAVISGGDFKSQLQEYVQLDHRDMPVYTVAAELGPDHDKTFVVRIDVCGVTCQGEGKSKKMAEQDAARQALKRLSGHNAG